jgi:hypothetical protein
MLRIGAKQPGPGLVVVREATCREHDTAPRPDLDLAPGGRDRSATNAPAHFGQAYDRRGCTKLNIQISGRSEQPAHQGQTVAQLHTAVMTCEVDQMPAETARDMRESPRRARHVHEGSEIRTGLDRHAHECRFAQRVTQLLDEVSQPSCVKWSRYD